jgi:GNAT superfamily N-acetyltransferase
MVRVQYEGSNRHAQAPVMAGDETSMQFLPADLAPGDTRSMEMPEADLNVARIHSSDHPLFAAAYAGLWTEFGPLDEMEPKAVIEQRLAWYPAEVRDGCWLRYEMVFVQQRGQLVAVRDHTVVATQRYGTPEAVVHLSHALIEPTSRRTGLAGWLRAFPLQTARATLVTAGLPVTAPITLVAEMEPPHHQAANRMIRLKAYEKAGFQKIDPSVVHYFQPDFRPPEIIDASGGARPLPFSLIIRRVGRESERVIRGAAVREIVECLYTIYGTSFRDQEMSALRQSLEAYPAVDRDIALVAPSQ